MRAICRGSFGDHHSLRVEELLLINQLQEESPFGMPETVLFMEEQYDQSYIFTGFSSFPN